MYKACSFGDFECVQLLVAAKADVEQAPVIFLLLDAAFLSDLMKVFRLKHLCLQRALQITLKLLFT